MASDFFEDMALPFRNPTLLRSCPKLIVPYLVILPLLFH